MRKCPPLFLLPLSKSCRDAINRVSIEKFPDMKTIFYALIAMATALVAVSCAGGGQQPAMTGFVIVENGGFSVDGKPYRFIGTNLWYAPILASQGQGGNRERLKKELDSLQALGINNLRILAGADGPHGIRTHIEPTLQPAPGVYNDTLLQGLDYLLCDLEQRGMKAVIYLTNSWEWSGGFSSHLEWTGHGTAPLPTEVDWGTWCKYARNFVLDDSAKHIYYRHVRHIVGRTNSLTGRPYSESPAIMAWQVCNEPRAFSREGKDSLATWIQHTAQIIKSIDPNHLVSTGSEGKYGCEVDIDLWARIHTMPEIDYAVIHIWPHTWQWVARDSVETGVEQACRATRAYIEEHHAALRGSGRPLVLEEFGYPRDGRQLVPGSPTSGRDAYYQYVFNIMRNDTLLAGCNFWGWGGAARPQHEMWQPGDPFTCDPAHEPQGLYSVFDCDTTTLEIIRKS